ncbi:MAG TPA: glycosyltransferase family 2 protein [Bryobacteraceae bacterium]|nr:glycosyltransferase family 2 protein [Bryobacteraceae bacterium]
MNAFFVVLQVIVLFLLAVGTVSFMAMVKGCFVLRRLARSTPRYDGNIILKSPLVFPVSVVVTIPDDSPESREFAQKLVELHFGKHELVLVLDGPTEAELETWTKEFRLCLSARGAMDDLPAAPIRGIYESRDPLRLVVVDKERGGQADALNAGINVAASPVIGLIDPLCEFEPTILMSLIRPMLDDPGPTVAVCGVMPPPRQSTAPTQGSRGGSAHSVWATRFYELETLRLWLARCAAFSGWNMLVPVPGASMLVLRDAVVKMGGFTAGPMELFLHLHGHARASGMQYRVAFVPEGVSHARVAGSFADLRSRNLRDERDILGALGHRKSISGGIRAIGWGLPGIFCVRCLRPVLETAAYPLAVAGLLTGWVDPALVGVLLLSAMGMGMVVSMAAVVLRELVEFHGSDPTRLAGLFFATIPENLVYRHVRNFWLIAGLFQSGFKKQNRG